MAFRRRAYMLGKLNPFRYRSYYYDNETGFYYLQSRYYDPTICRFVNADEVMGINDDMHPITYLFTAVIIQLIVMMMTE